MIQKYQATVAKPIVDQLIAIVQRDQQAALDFDYVAIGKVTQVAKQIVARYYAEPAQHSYFVGC